MRRRPRRGASGCCARWRDLPSDLQILYGVTGVRRLDEYEVPWLPGYEKSAPVRIGNAAAKQFQLDVYGEVMDTLHLARVAGLAPEPEAWKVQIALLKFLESHWELPDEGLWEVRGPRRHFTHSKVMAWVAFDRAIKDAEQDRLRRTHRALEAGARCHPRRGLRERLRPAQQFLRAVLRVEVSGREPAADPASGFSAGRRSAGSRHNCGRSNAI